MGNTHLVYLISDRNFMQTAFGFGERSSSKGSGALAAPVFSSSIPPHTAGIQIFLWSCMLIILQGRLND